MTMAHQYMHQLDMDVQHAIIGNCGTKIIFRVGHADALYMAREMKPYFKDVDFMHLPNYHIYLTLMIDGVPSQPFSATSLQF